MPDGILNLDKPRGPTSHDIVSRVRALTGVRRVGHAGTLDPLATGVLVVCLGRATRVTEYLMAPEYGAQKVYRARVRLGVATDTHDAEGKVVAEEPVTVTRAEVEDALARFRGTIAQIPPMFSALKREGEPLYRLARRGIEVAREARQVDVLRLELTGWEPPELNLEMTCSPGTYVRVLANDLGQALGCGAHLAALSRLASGDFCLDDSITLAEFTQAASEGRWHEYLQPLDSALARFPAVQLGADEARRLCQGQAIPISCSFPLSSEVKGEEMSLARAYGCGGTFLALVANDLTAGVWRPRKVLCSPER